MGFSSIPARIKAIERLANTSGAVICIQLPSDSAEVRAAQARMLGAAKARGRETIVVAINFGAGASATAPPASEGKDGAPDEG